MVELVVSMVIATILAGFVGLTITTPVESYMAQARRAELSDSAETAMRIIARDVSGALPESLRNGVVNGAETLEMIEVSAVAGYRAWTAGDPLQIGAPDGAFDAAGAQLTGRPLNRLVVGPNRSDATRNPYLNTPVISPAGPAMTFNAATRRFSLPAVHTFPAPGSPNQRAYAVVGTTRFVCDTAAGVLRRYQDLPIQPAMNALAGGTVIARDIASCRFRTLDSTAQNGGLAVVEITVSRAYRSNTENVRVMRQLRVENAP